MLDRLSQTLIAEPPANPGGFPRKLRRRTAEV
jgi:hypothetical protein